MKNIHYLFEGMTTYSQLQATYFRFFRVVIRSDFNRTNNPHRF